MSIGRIERLPVRELWPHEERDFSKWLEDNLEILGEALKFRIEPLEREKRVGSFRVDLVAEAASGDTVIIENQLQSSDHDHLGKLVTYFANLQAKIAVWIVATGRPEHVTAVNWLNESTPDDQAFYLVQLEAVRIGESQPAPLFTSLAGPTEESKAIGKEKKILGERHVARLRFWEQLLARANELGIPHHSNRTPSRDSWIGAGAGRAGFTWSYSIWKTKGAGVELYIDNGDADATLSYFDQLESARPDIESAFGAALDWQRLEDRRGCRIRYVIPCTGLESSESEWPEIQASMAKAMDRLVKSVGPRIPRLS